MSSLLWKFIFILFLFAFTAEGKSAEPKAPLCIAKTDVLPRSAPAIVIQGIHNGVLRPPSGLELGFLTGMNFSYAGSEPQKTGYTRNGLSFSATLEIPLAPYFSIQTEVGYAQRGVRTVMYNLLGYDITGNLNLDYFEVPVLAKAYYPIGSKTRLFFEAGPDFAVALNREIEVDSLLPVDLSSRFSSYDITALAGVGADYAISPTVVLNSMLRYNYGFRNIDSVDVYKTRVIQLLMGLKFKL